MRTLQPTVMLCVGLCFYLGGAAPEDTTEEKPPPPPIRITYDLTDLAHVSQVDPETTAVTPPTEINVGPAPQNNPPTRRSQTRDVSSADRMSALSKLVTETIDPTIWREAGGSEGQINVLDTRMIIFAPEPVHDKIVQLFADLRKEGNRSVRLTAVWASLTEDELRAVIVTTPENDKGGARIVDLAAVQKIKGAVRDNAEINALSGQRVNVTAGRARSFLSGMDAVVGNASAAMQPTIDLVLAGAALQITPALSADGKTVLLDLRAETSRWEVADAPPIKIPAPVATTQNAPASAGGATIEVERLNMPVHHLTTALRIPTGKAVLIGGMSTETREKDSRQLFLIIEAVGSR